MIEPLDCECIAGAASGIEGGRMPAAQENCEMHLLTTSATGETSFGGGITGSYQSFIKHPYYIIPEYLIPDILDTQL